MSGPRHHFLIGLAALLTTCAVDPIAVDDPGNGSETIARVRGTLYLPGGMRADSARIALFRAEHNPATDMPPSGNWITFSDSLGNYSLNVKIAGSGKYTLELKSPKTGLSLAHSRLVFGDSALSFVNDTLSPPGAVMVRLPSGTQTGTLYIPGSSRFYTAGPSDSARGYAVLDSIPAGTVAPVLFAPTGAENRPKTLQDSVHVASGVVIACRDVVVYSDSSSVITDTTVWVNCCSFTQDSSSGAYEGTRAFRFDYKIANWFAGAGMNLNDWGRLPAWDFSHCRAISFAYRGMSDGHTFNLVVRDADPDSTKELITVGGSSAEFTRIEVPLTRFSNINWHKVFEIGFGISGVFVDSGTVWIDDVRVLY